MQHVNTTSTFSAELPFPNTFNTHCDICSHPIAQPDLNILQPCFCGPFHGYCITNLELEIRQSNTTSSNPQLACPRCRQTVTTVAYDFLYHAPRASRKPFTSTPSNYNIPALTSQPPILPVAIHDTCPVTPSPSSQRIWFPYPNPTVPDLPQSWPSRAPSQMYKPNHEYASIPHLSKASPNLVHPSQHHPPQPDLTPSAPPPPQGDQPLPLDIDNCFPPPVQDFMPQSSQREQSARNTTPLLQRRHACNRVVESSNSRLERVMDLPSPHHETPPSPIPTRHQRRNESQKRDNYTHRDSPRTIVICRHVSEDDVRKGLYGDDVYKAYVEGKATVLGPRDVSKPQNGQAKDVNVKVEMDLHVYHHYKPYMRPTDQSQEHKICRNKERRKIKGGEKAWWKSPRSASRLESRDEQYHGERHRGRGTSRR